ncbi:MAG: hypothetical protein FWF02_05625 [Micrococcales bacterium]|nr:hypothetical protein [Micrococcales bacterium]MCL2667173.1 hypothetical protein [Micrococcales bacterium]
MDDLIAETDQMDPHPSRYPAASCADRLRAAISVLDRTGYPRGAEITAADARALLLARLLEAADEEEVGTP